MGIYTARQFAFGGATFVNRVIYIDGGYPMFDLILKSAHDQILSSIINSRIYC